MSTYSNAHAKVKKWILNVELPRNSFEFGTIFNDSSSSLIWDTQILVPFTGTKIPNQSMIFLLYFVSVNWYHLVLITCKFSFIQVLLQGIILHDNNLFVRWSSRLILSDSQLFSFEVHRLQHWPVWNLISWQINPIHMRLTLKYTVIRY